MPQTWSTFPHRPQFPIHPFVPWVSDGDIDDLKARLFTPPKRAQTWDNVNGPASLGVRHAWVDEAVKRWQVFDWRTVEAEIAQFPGFRAYVDFEGHTYAVHFLALWSQKPDAVPIVMSHGWPGSVLEFTPLLKHLTETYAPATLPYHVLVPSLIGYGWSSPPPLDRPFSSRDNAGIWDALMRGLGFSKDKGRGYLAQGGDIGSFVTRQLSQHESCLGIHLNFYPLLKSKNLKMADLDAVDQQAMKRAQTWEAVGLGYLVEHATKPGTIGAVLESSPLASLAWIGEKLMHARVPDPIEFVLKEVSLYWFTNTQATCLWEYRAGWGPDKRPQDAMPAYIAKPMGYSQFALEIYPTPISMVKERANVVWAKRHADGGHFIALEQPVTLWKDVAAFADQVVPAKSKL